MTLTAVDPCTRAQRCFFGHSKPIELLEASDDALWVASIQGADGGAPPLLRLWHVESCGGLRCLSVLSCPSLSSVRVASFDALSKFLALAGNDLQGRPRLMVWDISRVLHGGNISLCAKQTSADWDIDCVKFSPFEELHLVTCGRESIRFWRAKDKHLPGCSVVLNSLARQSHFTCIAFEFNKMGQPYFLGEHLGDRHRMFVGTNKGRLLQLSYKDRKVQVVHQLHNAAITAVCACEGFVVTASADKYVRVWPLDFKSYIMHAMHESSVVGVDITVDGLQVLCSTADGSVGLLDMQTRNYVDLVRTHSGIISDAAVSLLYQEVVTSSHDGTLKVWSLTTMSQTYEFTIPEDVPLAVAFHPVGRHLIAVGFRSGCMRVFDVDGPNMICEYRHHVQPILSLSFTKDVLCGASSQNTYVLTCDATGSLVFYDEARNFEVVRCPERILCTPPPDNCPAMICAPPWLLQYLDPHCIGIFSLARLDLEHKLRIPNSTICTFSLSFDSQLAVLGTSDSRIHLFAVASGEHVAAFHYSSGKFSAVALTSFNLTGSFEGVALMIVAASDSQLRIAQVHKDDLRRHPPGISRAAETGNSSSIPYDHVNEQCFIGHAAPPHKFLMTPNFLVSVSHSEVISWANASNYFEQLFVDSVLADCRTTRRPEKVQMQSGVVNDRSSDTVREDPVAAAEEPSAEQETQRQKAFQVLESTSQPAPEVSHSVVEDVALVENQERPLTEGFQQSQQQSTQLVADLSVQLAGQPVDLVDDAIPEQTGDVAIPEQTVDDAIPERSDVIAEPCSQSRERQEIHVKLHGISGCSLFGSAQPFSWQSESGMLCHSLGGAIHVEKRLLDLGSSSSSGALLTAVPGSTVLGLDLCPSGEGRLAVLSVGTNDSTYGSWLSLWCLSDIKMLAMGKLTDDYARQEVSLLSLPVLRATDGGQKVVTAASVVGAGGRVDVWMCQGNLFSAFSSALIQFAPHDLLLLSPSGGEFLTLGAGQVMFWRCLVDDVSEFAASLQFQPAETHGVDNRRCTAFCLVSFGTWQMLLVGTEEGHVLAYNADENQFLADVTLSAEGSSISAMGCASWPWLVCSFGNALKMFKLERSPEGFLEAAASGSTLHFDGDIRVLCMQGLASEGIISTSGNSLWYFNMHEGKTVCLEQFHNASSYSVKSNTAFFEAKMDVRPQPPATPEVIATVAEDGCLCIWTSDGSRNSSLQAVAMLRSSDTCGAVSFLSEAVLACAMFSGFVCIYSLNDLALMANIEITAGDPLLALEAISCASLVIGSAGGQITLLCVEKAPDQPASITGTRKIQLPCPTPDNPDCCPAVTGIVLDREVTPRRFMVLHAGLEAWLWECQSTDLPQHVRTWQWPESEPRPLGVGCSRDQSECLSLLSSPPLVASFIQATEAESLVVMCAPPAACFYVYSCEQGSIVDRITLGQQIPSVVKLWAPPPWNRSRGVARSQTQTSLLVLGSDSFAILNVYDRGGRACWSEEAQQLPGSCLGVKTRRGTPSACCIKSDEGDGDCYRIVLKSDAALSSWTMV